MRGQLSILGLRGSESVVLQNLVSFLYWQVWSRVVFWSQPPRPLVGSKPQARESIEYQSPTQCACLRGEVKISRSALCIAKIRGTWPQTLTCGTLDRPRGRSTMVLILTRRYDAGPRPGRPCLPYRCTGWLWLRSAMFLVLHHGYVTQP